MREGRLNNLLLLIVPPLVAWLMRIWFGSCRVTVHNGEYAFPPEEADDNVVIASFWHYSLVYIFFFLRKYSATAMVSASGDGEYIARLAKHLGFNTVRGSKNARAVEALKIMLKVLKDGDTCAIVADGSRGPARVAQPGALLLASKGGVPILPMTWSASSYFTIKSWDRLAIPRPFAKIDFYFGRPIEVPAGLKSAALEEYRLLLEERLNELYHEAWSLHGRLEH